MRQDKQGCIALGADDACPRAVLCLTAVVAALRLWVFSAWCCFSFCSQGKHVPRCCAASGSDINCILLQAGFEGLPH